jgi:hypothetical protein
VRHREAKDAGPWTAGAIVAGWVVAALIALLNHQYIDVAISAAAGWVTLVLLFVSLRNLAAFLERSQGSRFWPRQQLNVAVRPYLAPAAFLIGIVVGRLIWH